MLNQDAINTLPINGGGLEPTEIRPLYSYRWRLGVRIAGEDMSARLTGKASIDREENASGLASVSLQLAPGPVVPLDWIGRSIEIDFIFEVGGRTRTARRFTGQVSDPGFDPASRVLTLQCTDQRQKRVEAMSLAEIDTLVGGWWSEDVFEKTEGRSHWDYATERLGTLPAALDSGPNGALRVTSWLASSPAFLFGDGSTVYGSVAVELAQLDRLINVVEIEGGYRYARLWQQNNSYTWAHAGAGGHVGYSGLCHWLGDSTELPTVEMVEEAVKSSGQAMLSGTYYNLPGSDPDPCLTGSPWINNFPNLLLGASFMAGRRWVQQVTEQFKVRVQAPASIAQAGEQIGRERVAIEVEDVLSEEWESEDFKGGKNGAFDLGDPSRRQAAVQTVLQQAATQILESHRDTAVRWQVPSPLAVDIDLVHTLRIEDQGIRAQGKCRHIEEEFDLGAGLALTTISIAVMRGGGTLSDPLLPPLPAAETEQELQSGGQTYQLATHIGGRSSSPPYDETWTGFSGNYSAWRSAEDYPRQFKIEAPEIPEAMRDEKVRPVEATISIAIPDDLLEL